MDYIVFDLEWNQGSADQEAKTASLPFEIVEIGAVKISCDSTSGKSRKTGEYSRLIKPVVYHEMNRITGELIHLKMQELEKGVPFVKAAEGFLRWCGPEYLFCTWGSSDLTELQRNMKFHGMSPLSDGPIAFLDVQKLFSIAFEDGKTRKALSYAVDFLGVEKDVPFHRAFGDAYYTAKILRRILKEKPETLRFLSYDVFHPPVNREAELKIQFSNYVKYISREFNSKQEAFADKEVASSKCYLCRRNLRKKLRWFSTNGRNYYCLAYCETHGYLKCKIRVRKSENDKVYIVKTSKFIPAEETVRLRELSSRARELHKRRKEESGKAE